MESPELGTGASGQNAEALSVLASFGLTGYQARAYLALLELGPAQAREVSDRSAVPQGRVYDILEKLHEQGLAEVLPEAPRRYRAVPFETFLERELQRHRERAESLEKDRLRILDVISSVSGAAQPVSERGEYLVLRGRKNVLERVAGLVGGAQRDLLVLGSERTPQRLRGEGLLANLKTRGNRARLLVPVVAQNVDAVKEVVALGAEVRHLSAHEGFPPGLNTVLADSARAVLFQHVPDDLSTVRGDDVGLLVEHPEMVKGLQALVEALWALGTPLELRLRQLAGGTAEAMDLRGHTILVVDDEPDIVASMQEILETSVEGVKVLTAETGPQALAILKDTPVDLIITDYRLPGMNGIEFLEQAGKVAAGVQRILITAFPDLKVALKAINEAGVENFFTKPLEPGTMVEVVRRVLDERRAQDLRDRAVARTMERSLPKNS